MSWFYILDAQGVPQPVPDSRVIIRWMERMGPRTTLAEDELPDRGPIVSTYFTGVDCAPDRDRGPPLLWATRVHRGWPGMQSILQTYPSAEAALAGHQTVLEFVRAEVRKLKGQA